MKDNAESLASVMKEAWANILAVEAASRLGLLPVHSPGWLLGTSRCSGGPGVWAAATSFPGRGGTYLAERESL